MQILYFRKVFIFIILLLIMFIDTFRFDLKLKEYHGIGTKMLKKLLISILHFLITLIIILKIIFLSLR